jgi:hypothetical protein
MLETLVWGGGGRAALMLETLVLGGGGRAALMLETLVWGGGGRAALMLETLVWGGGGRAALLVPVPVHGVGLRVRGHRQTCIVGAKCLMRARPPPLLLNKKQAGAEAVGAARCWVGWRNCFRHRLSSAVWPLHRRLCPLPRSCGVPRLSQQRR